MTDKRKPNQGGKSIFTGSKTPTEKLHIAKPDKIDPNLTSGKKGLNEKSLEEPVGNIESSGQEIPSDKPKIEQKSFEEITAHSVVKLPHNQVKPVNGRIFCIEVDPGEMKTAGGLYLPTRYTKPEARGSQEIKIMRYFAVDVADDCTIRFTKTVNSTPSKIERGDEIFPFFPDVVDFKFATLHDFYNGYTYTVFHETELGGVGVSSLLKKEK